MAKQGFEASNEEELDWDNMSNPVPLDLIDADFPPQAPAESSRPPGARSEILPREESEALARSTDDTLEMPARSAPSDAGTVPADPTLQMPAREDAFTGIRAKMEADAEVENQANRDAEKEEAAQRERLEQWMANARARLVKADADLAGPAARIRIRKESSPSLYRLAEMQKTMWVEGQATLAESPSGSFRSIDGEKAKQTPLDPMATISVSAEQFLSLDAPAQPTQREQALARQSMQQLAQQMAVQQAAERKDRSDVPPAPNAEEAKAAPADLIDQVNREIREQAESSKAGNRTAFTPLTREQALTRKVAQLRKVAEGGDNTVAIAAPDDHESRSALHYAIAAVVLIAICVLGVGLFAATQAGLFDGLENTVPFLRPKVSALPARPAAPKPVPQDQAPVAAPPGNQRVASALSARPVPRATAGTQAASPAMSSATARPAQATVLRPAEPRIQPAARLPKPPAARPEPSARRPARKIAVPALSDDLPAAPASEDAVEPTEDPKPSNLGEIILRSSVQAAINIDTDNLQQMYSRYALGFPGLSGEVVLGLTVDPGGHVLEANIISSTMGVADFDQELQRKVLGWRLRAFPESRPKFIKVPFLFPLQGH
ncbi:MAG: TonB family C-terminal protein [Fibrobacteres bacterium]|nr:TonB family C-terminal protein [Fibrobacterota bacterium]